MRKWCEHGQVTVGVSGRESHRVHDGIVSRNRRWFSDQQHFKGDVQQAHTAQ